MKKTKCLSKITTTKKVIKKPRVKFAVRYVGLHRKHKTK